MPIIHSKYILNKPDIEAIARYQRKIFYIPICAFIISGLILYMLPYAENKSHIERLFFTITGLIIVLAQIYVVILKLKYRVGFQLQFKGITTVGFQYRNNLNLLADILPFQGIIIIAFFFKLIGWW